MLRPYITLKLQQKIHIGKDTTRGLGAGADPSVGRKAAEESKEEIKKAVEGADMVFVTIGAGGGTGSGAGAIVAQAATDIRCTSYWICYKTVCFRRRKKTNEMLKLQLKTYDNQ